MTNVLKVAPLNDSEKWTCLVFALCLNKFDTVVVKRRVVRGVNCARRWVADRPGT